MISSLARMFSRSDTEPPRRSAAAPETEMVRTPAPGRPIGRRTVILLCLLAIIAASASIVAQTEGFQDWRLTRLSLPSLQQELRSHGENARLLYYIGKRLNEQKRFTEADGYLRQ